MCDCVESNEFDCYAETHEIEAMDRESIETCGGPCKCECHYNLSGNGSTLNNQPIKRLYFN